MDAIEHAFVGGAPLDCEAPRDALSIETVIRSHHDALIRFLRKRLRSPDDASDVAQETYIRMMQYDGSRQIQSPSSMLYRIAINVANDLGRSEMVRRAGDQLPLEEVVLVSDQPRGVVDAGPVPAVRSHRPSAPQVPAGIPAQPGARHDLSGNRATLRDFG